MAEAVAPLRLPGSIAEIDASPQGAEVGAFFDVDGTLVAGFTAAVHARDGMRDMGVREMARMLKMSVDYKIGRSDFDALVTSGTREAYADAAPTNWRSSASGCSSNTSPI